MEERDIEIRINPFDNLGDCVFCNSSSSDPDNGKARKPNLPELFTANNDKAEWVCVYCARYRVPALAELIMVARMAEKYNKDHVNNSGESRPDSPQKMHAFALRIDSVAKDRPCGICEQMTVSSSYPSYKPGFPEMFLGENIICAGCSEDHAPTLQAFLDLAQAAERYAEFLPVEHWPKCNGNPEMVSHTDRYGWITCPNCHKRFSSKDKQRWYDNLHITCGQKIILSEVC